MSPQKHDVCHFSFSYPHKYSICNRNGYKLYLRLDPYRDAAGTVCVKLTVSTKNTFDDTAEELQSLDGKVGFFDNGTMYLVPSFVVHMPTRSFGMLCHGKRVLKLCPSHFPLHTLWLGPSVMQCDTLGKPIPRIGDTISHNYGPDILFLYDSGNKRFFFKIHSMLKLKDEKCPLHISFGTSENTQSDWNPSGLSIRIDSEYKTFDVNAGIKENIQGNWYGIILRKPEPLGLLMNGQLFFEIHAHNPTYDLRWNTDFLVARITS